MNGEENNLTDTKRYSNLPIKDGSMPVSHIKTSKLITALFMVTDIIEKDEPLRHKLRTLGSEILSGIHNLSVSPSFSASMLLDNKITETMSFLDIASTVNIISEMNAGILKREFTALKQSIQESFSRINLFDGQTDLSKFFAEELPVPRTDNSSSTKQYIGQIKPTRIGVQRGDTLMRALSDKGLVSSMGQRKMSNIKPISNKDNFDVLKKQRREEIISVIKNNSKTSPSLEGGSTITDIKSKAVGSLAGLGEKTLQRELVSMVKDGILGKTGEKRWSRYSISS